MQRSGGLRKKSASGKRSISSQDINVLSSSIVYCEQLRFTNDSGSVIVNNGPPGSEPIAQGTDCINIGSNAGKFGQGTRSIAIGVQAGEVSLGLESVAIGPTAARYNTTTQSISIGHQAGFCNTPSGPSASDFGQKAVAIGNQAGFWNQAAQTVAIGRNAGKTSIGIGSIAIGSLAGASNLGQASIAIGERANELPNNGVSTISIGYSCGKINQGGNSVAIGYFTGNNSQNSNNIAIGVNAQDQLSGIEAVAIGAAAGFSNQGQKGVAIGITSATNNQAYDAVAIGYRSGFQSQKDTAIAIGNFTGFINQGRCSIAIGNSSGTVNQHPFTTIIGNGVSPTLGPETFYIGNIQDISVDNSGFTGILEWDSSTKEIYVNTAKTFIIDHPVYLDKYLVHSCLEGPEAAVYYRGSFDITEGLKKYKITLPDYLKEIGKNFQVIASKNSKNQDNRKNNVICSDVINGEHFFIASTLPCNVNYCVFATRHTIDTEIDKVNVNIKGQGPYKYIS